ncbi:MAG TPA: pitrilysin family protein [Spirochaetota bacterium]
MTRYTLPNGLVVILQPIESAVSLSVGLWVRTGSRHEKASEYGYAHFVEHMLFKGTEKFTAKEIAQTVDRVGGQHNAATNREYTCYYINVVSDYLELSLNLLSDMYYNSLIDPEEIEKEKGVVLEEMRMYDDTPDELIHDIFMDAMFKNHPIGHPIIGNEESIKSMTRESLLAFYDTHYYSQNTVLVIAGRFEESTAQSFISQFFAKERPLLNAFEPVICKPERIFHAHVERDLEQVHLNLGFTGITKNDDSRWGMYLLSTILGGSMSSRLFQRVRESEGLCYSVYSFHSSYVDGGVFGVYCGTSPDKYSHALDLIIDECGKIAREPISGQDLLDAKSFMKGSLALSLESIEVRMGQLARNEILYGRNYDFDEMSRLIDAVTADEFMRVAQSILLSGSATLVTIGKIGDDKRDGITL